MARMNWDKARREEIVRERGSADPPRPRSGGVRTSADGFALILSRYGGTCAACGKRIVKGRRMKWRSRDKTMLHTSCTLVEPMAAPSTEMIGRQDPDRYRPEIERRRKAAEGFHPGQSARPTVDAGSGPGGTRVGSREGRQANSARRSSDQVGAEGHPVASWNLGPWMSSTAPARSLSRTWLTWWPASPATSRVSARSLRHDSIEGLEGDLAAAIDPRRCDG